MRQQLGVVPLRAKLHEGTVLVEHGHVTGWKIEQLARSKQFLVAVGVADPDGTLEQVAPMWDRTRVARQAAKGRREVRPCLDLGVGARHSFQWGRAQRDVLVIHECTKFRLVVLHKNPPKSTSEAGSLQLSALALVS